MIDQFALAITHALMALAFWRLSQCDLVDRDPPQVPGSPEDAPSA